MSNPLNMYRLMNRFANSTNLNLQKYNTVQNNKYPKGYAQQQPQTPKNNDYPKRNHQQNIFPKENSQGDIIQSMTQSQPMVKTPMQTRVQMPVKPMVQPMVKTVKTPVQITHNDEDEIKTIIFQKKSQQNEISKNPIELKKRFDGYTLIYPHEYKSVEQGTFIRYLKDRKLYRYGGILVMNKYPNYWVLESVKPGKRHRWSVQLKSNNAYFKKKISQKSPKKKPAENTKLQHQKDVLYNAVASGKYTLVPKSAMVPVDKIVTNAPNAVEESTTSSIVLVNDDDSQNNFMSEYNSEINYDTFDSVQLLE